jgi:hypothetical protein
MRAWSGRWIDADGELAIPPQRSSPFVYPKSIHGSLGVRPTGSEPL